MRWGIVGMNGTAFVHTSPCSPDAPRLSERFASLELLRLHQGSQRDLASALKLGMKVLLERSAARYGIIYLTAGRPSSEAQHLREAIDRATSLRVGVHGILLGTNAQAEHDLREICTKPCLGYGDFHQASSVEGLNAALEQSVRGLITPPSTYRFNRVVFVVDLTDRMADHLGEQTCIRACGVALNKITRRALGRGVSHIKQTAVGEDWRPGGAYASR